MNREYEIADKVLLSKPIEMRGYVLPEHSEVTIIDYLAVDIPSENYIYSVLVINPLTGKEERYENWIVQEDLLSKLEELELICRQLNLV